MRMAREERYPRETTMRHFQNKRISTTAVVLSVAIISLGGNVSAGERGNQQSFIGMNGIVGMNGIISMNGVSSPPPMQRFYYQQRQP
jgi:hypothetical protein